MKQRRRRSKEQLRAIFAKFQAKNFPHQERVVQKVTTTNPRLLAFHGLGSGKTRTGLLTAQKVLQSDPKSKVLFITPSGLVKNLENEQLKHKIKLNKKRVTALSYDKARRLGDNQYDLVVVDEAHKLREKGTKRYKEIEPILTKSNKLLLMSGSPMYHEPSNLSTLINLAAKNEILPDDPAEFEKRFVAPPFQPGMPPRLKNTHKLKEVLNKYVDYHEPDIEIRKKHYPRVSESQVKLELSPPQQKIYHYLEYELPPKVRKAVRSNLPLNKRDSNSLNRFSAGVRQVSNSSIPYVINVEGAPSAKIDKAVQNLTTRMQGDKTFRGLVYSNYLNAGINQYKDRLDKLKILNAMITGSMSAKKRDAAVRAYNEGQVKVLLISTAGGEGLDLKGTRLVQVLDPHWNEEKINQVVGRAIRYSSHSHLPENKRTVDVEHYLSTLKPSLFEKVRRVKPTSIDEYLYNRSKQKSQINSQLRRVMRG